MKSEIQKVRLIDRERLSKAHFFEHLIIFIEKKQLLNEGEMEHLQLQLINLLAHQIERFNHGMSSSIKNQQAESLMASIYYVLGAYFRELYNIDDSIEILKKKKLEEIFQEGQHIINEKFIQCQNIYNKLQEKLLETRNLAYQYTLNKGIGIFFDNYEEEFASHQTDGDIDYPLCLDLVDETGIFYIEGYLSRLTLENDFCRYFNNEEIEQMLKAYHKGYEHLLINIFEHTLMNALGGILLNREGIRISEEEREALYEALNKLNEDGLTLCFNKAAKRLIENMNITDTKLQQYIYGAVKKWLPIIKQSLINHDLTEVFAAEVKEERAAMTLIEGEKMSDDAFRKLIQVISGCSSAAEKVQYIKENVTSLEDLRDILEADCFFDEEFLQLYKQLSEIELALLMHLNMLDPSGNLDAEGIQAEGKAWKKQLFSYIQSLEKEKQERLLSAARQIE